MAEGILNTREELKGWLDQRIDIEAKLEKYGTRPEGNRTFQTALLTSIEMNGRVVCDHCWLDMAQPLRDAGVQPGDLFAASVTVYSYRQQRPDDHNQSVTRYAIRHPRDVSIFNRSAVSFNQDEFCSPRAAPPAPPANDEPKPLSLRETVQRLKSVVDAVGKETLAKVLPRLTEINDTVALVGGGDAFCELFAEIYGNG